MVGCPNSRGGMWGGLVIRKLVHLIMSIFNNFKNLPLGIRRILLIGVFVPLLITVPNSSNVGETISLVVPIYIGSVLVFAWIVAGFKNDKK